MEFRANFICLFSCRTTRSNKLGERVNGSPRSWTNSPSSSPKAGPSSALEDSSAGYNSGDEHGPSTRECCEAEWLKVRRRIHKIFIQIKNG